MLDTALITRASAKRGSSLQARVPHLAAEWHPTKNGSLGPSDVHAGSPNKAWWICSQDHAWFATIRDRVRKGAGCPFCTGKRAAPTNCVAMRLKGLELWHPSKNLPETPWTVTPGSNRKFWWRCQKGHEWRALPNNVLNHGSGCPGCVFELDSKRERECRGTIERLTGHAFPKAKPLWLRSDRGFQLEFDGYAETLGVAFEHHGVQHYQHTPFFHKKTKFERVQELDRIKRARCIEQGIHLIEIRWDCTNIEGFILQELQIRGVRLCGM